MSKPTNQQKAAIDANGSVLLSAGAGTGKTATLVERCVRLVVNDGVPVDRLLVVTFTNAAAAEMKQRLREALQEKIAEKPGDQKLQQQLLLLDVANISTIHAFCLQLIRSHFEELGISPGVAVLDESITTPMKLEIARQLIAEKITEDKPVQRLGEAYFAGDGGRLMEQIIKIHQFYGKQRGGIGEIDSHLKAFDAKDCTQWEQYRINILRDWVKEWQPKIEWQVPQTIRKFPAVRGFGGQSPTADKIRELEKYLPNFQNRFCGLSEEVALEDLTSMIAEAAKMVGKDFWGHGPGGKQGVIKDFVAEARELLVWLPNNDIKADPLQADWDAVRLPAKTLLELTKEFADAYAAAKRARGGVDFADQEQMVTQLLQRDDIAKQWRARFDHIVVDECQDISPIQDELIRKLSGCGAHCGAEHSLFMVGDVKQSIYRFRMADPSIFQDYAKRWKSGCQHHQVLALTENFRSREGILAFANSLFGHLLQLPFGGIQYGEEQRLQLGNHKERVQFSLKPGQDLQLEGTMSEPDCRVEIHLIDKSTAEADETEDDTGRDNWGDLLDIEKQAGVAAERLRELKNGGHQIWDKDQKIFRKMDWGDVGILMRFVSDRTGAFHREFRRRGIPLVAEQGDFLATVEAQDLTALLRVLDNPRQDIPLFAVLRSPLVGLSLDELAGLFASEKKIDAYDRLLKAKGEADLRKFLDQLDRWRRLALLTSLSCVLETVLAETRYEAFLLTLEDGPDRVANVRRFLELARAYDPLQRQGISRFLKFIAEQQDAEQEVEPLPPRQTQAVRLMTIHKSKGLEFPVVVVAGIGAAFNQQPSKEQMPLSSRWGGLAPMVVNTVKRERRDSLISWQVKREEKQETLSEELRLLYVAVTRARDTLLLVGSYTPPKDVTPEDNKPNKANELIELPANIGVSKADNYSHWLMMWAYSTAVKQTTTQDGFNLQFSHKGPPCAVRWRNYRAGQVTTDTTKPSPASVEKVSNEQLRRFDWQYPHGAATQIPAKTSASALRRLSLEADEDVTPDAARRSVFRKNTSKLDAAAIGTAHHTFLQHLEFAKAVTEAGLKEELARMIRKGWLTQAEGDVVKLSDIQQFLKSPIGQRVLSADQTCIRRELPFTAAFRPAELDPFKDKIRTDNDEMVVVQGFIDLAVVEPDRIWLVDFKTDRIEKAQLSQRVEEHTPQLRLYAKALERVYKTRKVISATLYFLHIGGSAEMITQA